MPLFDHPDFDHHEHVSFYQDKESGLKAIIAVHNTNLGPALGGCRMYPYKTSNEALTDVLRLSKGMTYKAAMANIALGGGKSVIIGDPRSIKSSQMMAAMGRFVDSFQGSYFTAEDSGISVQDLKHMESESKYIAGTSAKYHFNGENADGNPAPGTAYGVFVGIQAAAQFGLNSNLNGVKVAIQGMGHVGTRLARHLKQAGAELFIADVFEENTHNIAEEIGAKVVSADDVLSLNVDILAPCALGSPINSQSFPNIKAKVIAGAANNQLATEEFGTLCFNKGIVYAPDYVINAGGIIDIYHQRMESSNEKLKCHIEKIGETLTEIFERSKQQQQATNIIANVIAQERFSK